MSSFVSLGKPTLSTVSERLIDAVLFLIFFFFWASLFTRDQSCTDILDLYQKLKSEVSSGEEAEVRCLTSVVLKLYLV